MRKKFFFAFLIFALLATSARAANIDYLFNIEATEKTVSQMIANLRNDQRSMGIKIDANFLIGAIRDSGFYPDAAWYNDEDALDAARTPIAASMLLLYLIEDYREQKKDWDAFAEERATALAATRGVYEDLKDAALINCDESEFTKRFNDAFRSVAAYLRKTGTRNFLLEELNP